MDQSRKVNVNLNFNIDITNLIYTIFGKPEEFGGCEIPFWNNLRQLATDEQMYFLVVLMSVRDVNDPFSY